MTVENIDFYISNPDHVLEEWRSRKVIPFFDDFYSNDKGDGPFARCLYWGKDGDLRAGYFRAFRN